MEDGDGEKGAAKRTKLSAAAAAAGEDRLSALPDDLLVQVLLRIGGTTAAARTSVLSRRWRSLWCLLPELDFVPEADGGSIRAALAAYEPPSLRHLLVAAQDAAPHGMAEWLPVAARRLAGDLLLFNMAPKRDAKDDDDEEGKDGSPFLELPCFGSATKLSLDLGFLPLAVPVSGVFARLTDLSLDSVRFHGPCEFGDAASSRRFPSLKNLNIRNTQGLSNFIIHSDSLLQLDLRSVRGLKQLNVVAPALQVLSVFFCFADTQARSQPVADIAAPQLETLQWEDAFDPSSVEFGEMAKDFKNNRDCLRLLKRFRRDAISRLTLTLAFLPKDLRYFEYLMENMTMLPDIVSLNLNVLANAHAIGPSLFHVLRMCTSVRRLKLVTHISLDLEAQAVCSSDCVCDLPPNWKTEELLLKFLHEVEINNFRGTGHEIALVKRLFSWAVVLKDMTINFYHSVPESTAKEVCQMLLNFSRPEICMKIYFYHRWRLLNVVPKTKRDEGEGAAAGEVLELPCFASAANLALDLGFIAVAMPRSGVFSRLTLLSLDNVRFHRPCDLGDAVSSPRSPFLKRLTIQNAHGLSNLSIHSESLLQIRLGGLKGLKQLNVVAPALGALYVISCFSDPLAMSQPVADISAPQLETLHWEDAFDPSSVRFGNMANVKCLGTHFYLAFGQEDFGHNGDCLRLLQRFQFDALDRLSLTLAYMSELNDLENEYLMEEMTMLPDIMFLGLTVLASGHAIGPSVFHVLRMSTSIRRLELATDIYSSNPQARAACSSSCTCDLPPNWKTEELKLAFLHEVEINNFRGTEHQIALVKQLFGWAAMLKDMTINFCHSITESMARKARNTHEFLHLPTNDIRFCMFQRTNAPH
uniref:F-box domain-containing protein n=1 Tax=Oryza barthii TaxID=65489 RepID=A0A0D3GLN4_9ORYZ